MSKQKLITFLLFILFVSCDDGSNEIRFFFIGEEEYQFIDSIQVQDDYAIILYQYDVDKRNLVQGYNNLEISFYDFKSGKYTSNVSYDLNVFKLSDNDTVFAPYYADQVFNNIMLANSPIYFTEASGESNWIVEISGEIEGRQFLNKMEFNDVEPGVYFDNFQFQGSEYLLNLVQPLVPKVGIEPLEISLHKKTGNKYIPAENFTTAIQLYNDEIQNPPGLIAPTKSDFIPAHYIGNINITESSDWTLEIEFLMNGESAFIYKQDFFVKVEA